MRETDLEKMCRWSHLLSSVEYISGAVIYFEYRKCDGILICWYVFPSYLNVGFNRLFTVLNTIVKHEIFQTVVQNQKKESWKVPLSFNFMQFWGNSSRYLMYDCAVHNYIVHRLVLSLNFLKDKLNFVATDTLKSCNKCLVRVLMLFIALDMSRSCLSGGYFISCVMNCK